MQQVSCATQSKRAQRIKDGVFAASRSAMPERTSSCSSALQLSWVSEAVSPYGSMLRSEGLRRMINALAGKIIAAETAASTMYPVRQPCCSMTSVTTGLNNSVQRELTPQARPMARPDDLLNHWSMTSDMQTPVVNEKQMPITAAETVNIQTSV